ncbi:TadE/TadG family type IV pilus assembly protein [Agrobacterium sp. NPDC089420]|uniref:TadE/TadG family type IV pilus assembly protein n=1 Tax=Agrobacterium sp. NPDC089420 TaxID=3363918 RepID=UPI00384BA656
MKNIWRDRSGNFAILSAVLMIPLFGAAGVALDITRGVTIKSDLQMAADSAALAVVADTSASAQAARTMSGDGVITVGAEEAAALFHSNQRGSADYKLLSLEVSVIKRGTIIESAVNFRASVTTTLTRLLGTNFITVGGSATAKYETETFTDFYLLLDNSPSMGVGATPADVATMQKVIGCAFACHLTTKDGTSDPASTYFRIKNKDIDAKDRINATTRIDVVAKATASLMDTAAATRKSKDQYRIAVYTFGKTADDAFPDQDLFEVVSRTSDLQEAKKKVGDIELMSVPYHMYNNDQHTSFDRALTKIEGKMGASGSGASSATPEKIVFFVSDGVGDSYKPNKCTKQTTQGGRCQEPIDIRLCTKLKEKGFRIAVLYTTYLPLTGNGWYRLWIQPFQTEISSRMQACASAGLFFEVSPSQGISEAMSALFKKAISAPRLTS